MTSKIVRACFMRGARSRRSCGWWEKRGRWRGGLTGVGGKNENYVMDGLKNNDVISTAYRCLLLRPISIVSGAFGQTRRKWEGGGDIISH